MYCLFYIIITFCFTLSIKLPAHVLLQKSSRCYNHYQLMKVDNDWIAFMALIYSKGFESLTLWSCYIFSTAVVNIYKILVTEDIASLASCSASSYSFIFKKYEGLSIFSLFQVMWNRLVVSTPVYMPFQKKIFTISLWRLDWKTTRIISMFKF